MATWSLHPRRRQRRRSGVRKQPKPQARQSDPGGSAAMVTQRGSRGPYHCSFCGKSQDQVRRLIAGPGSVYICDECVELCREIITEENAPATRSKLPASKLPTPKKIYDQLNQYVIGQD